jgi:hypothetical protein
MDSDLKNGVACSNRKDPRGLPSELAKYLRDAGTGSVELVERLKEWWTQELGWDRAAEMATASITPQERTVHEVENSSRYMIWVDGVGGYLVCLSPRVVIGGPGHGSGAADVSLLANLSRRHATIHRASEGYVLEAHAPVKVADRIVEGVARLNDNYALELGEGVRLRFRIPSVLSATAVLDFVSDHRPSRSVDGVVLLDETCLLGSGNENHIRCPEWNESILLFRKEGKFWCKSQSDLVIGGKVVQESAPIEPGDVVSGLDLRFRIEQIA